MKCKYIFSYLVCFVFFFLLNHLNAQNTSTNTVADTSNYLIIKNDGAEYMGKILSHDAREILLETNTIGQVIIPKHEIKEIRKLYLTHKDLKTNGIFSTRYFITTNGLPIKKNDSYILWNLYGPDFEFALKDNLGIGVMTSWVGIPVVASLKYSIKLYDNVHLGMGTLVGSGSWAASSFVIGLPYLAATLGDRNSNISFSAGYGGFSYGKEKVSAGFSLFSLAATTKLGKNLSLVFDSFIAPYNLNTENQGFAILIPGVRWQSDDKKAFQFGFGGIIVDDKVAPVPIPMVQWFRKIN